MPPYASGPSLLGLNRSNRDFSLKDTWGKNQFNNAFPASLACYMHRKGLDPVYLTLDDSLKIKPDINISVQDLFGADPESPDLYFNFESPYTPYAPLFTGKLPRADLVTMTAAGGQCLRDIEIKLTALPDSSTVEQPDCKQSCEIVVRPDTIVYAALSIARIFEGRKDELIERLDLEKHGNVDWQSSSSVRPLIPKLADALDNVLRGEEALQSPLVLQPVWKTVGKTLQLHEHCFDLFVWSNFALTRLFLERAKLQSREQVSREMRSVVWLVKMLHDFGSRGKINADRIINELVYAPKTDKAFSIQGSSTHQYMKSDQLTQPRVQRTAVKEIILGGGEKYLSPERRLDAVIQSTFDLL